MPLHPLANSRPTRCDSTQRRLTELTITQTPATEAHPAGWWQALNPDMPGPGQYRVAVNTIEGKAKKTLAKGLAKPGGATIGLFHTYRPLAASNDRTTRGDSSDAVGFSRFRGFRTGDIVEADEHSPFDPRRTSPREP